LKFKHNQLNLNKEKRAKKLKKTMSLQDSSRFKTPFTLIEKIHWEKACSLLLAILGSRVLSLSLQVIKLYSKGLQILGSKTSSENDDCVF